VVETSDKRQGTLTRRQILKWGGLVAASSLSTLVIACGGGGTSTATVVPATAAPSTGGVASVAPTVAATRAVATASSATAGVASATVGGASTPSASGAATSAYQMRTNVRGNIDFWHFWGSPVRRNAIRRIIGEFGAVYSGIKVNETYVPFGDIFTRLLTTVAAGSGMPDAIVDDRSQLRARAANQIDTSFADLAKRDNVTGEAFWPFTWTETIANNEPFGLPYETDIRVLYYNKAALADAGLDPEKPPTNWDELTASADKIDQKDGDKLVRIAFYPTVGNIGLDTWGWCNGGEWQTSDNTPTINRAENVAALTWMKTWADRYGVSNFNAFKGSFGQGNQDEFMSGKVAMKVDIQGYTSQLNFYNPKFLTKDKKDLGYGVAAIPPAPGHKPASFSGGFAITNPRGSKNHEQAWEFAKYLAFVGQAGWARDTYAMPTVEKMAKTDPSLNADPNWKFFVSAMDYGRPGVFNPNYPTMMSDVVTPAFDDVTGKNKSPQQALDDAQKKAEQEIAKNKR